MSLPKRHYVAITETRSIVIAVDGADNGLDAVVTAHQAYNNGKISLSDENTVVEDRTTFIDETKDWSFAVAQGYDDTHFPIAVKQN